MWPMWVHALISRYWQALSAETVYNAAIASMAPHTKPSDYRRMMALLEADAAILRAPRTLIEPMPKERIDPVAAAEWFASQGVKVVTSG